MQLVAIPKILEEKMVKKLSHHCFPVQRNMDIKVGKNMRCPNLLFRLLSIGAAVCMLASCTTTNHESPAVTMASPTPSPVLAKSTSSIEPSQPHPSYAETQPPIGLQHPLPTAMPDMISDSADKHLDANDYYVVTEHGRQGIVDKNGKIVLPFDFIHVDVTARNVPYESFGCVENAKFFGLTSDHEVALYDVSGRKIASKWLGYAVSSGPDIISVMKKPTNEVEEDFVPRNCTGAILNSGKQIIPFQYDSIQQFGKAIAGLKYYAETCTSIDFYSLEGKLLHSMQGGYEVHREVYTEQMIIMNSNGLYGVLDDQLEWVIPAEYQSIDYDEYTGQYIVEKNGFIEIVDCMGNAVIPAKYNSFVDSGFGFGNTNAYQCGLYTLMDDAGIHLFDRFGKELFQCNGYNLLEYSNDVIIAYKAIQKDAGGYSYWQVNRSDMYDMSGNFLLSISEEIEEYMPEYQYFMGCGKVFNRNGTELLMPGHVMGCMSANRFIVNLYADGGSLQSEACGLCDAQGNWMLKPIYEDIQQINGNAILYTVRSDQNDRNDSGVMSGLADLDGHMLTAPIFYEFELGQRELIYVSTLLESGLMDINLKWVWKTSSMDELSD